MREKLFGTIIPDAIVARLEAAADPAAEGRKLCLDLMRELATIPGVAGVHIMAPGNEAAIADVIKRRGGIEAGEVALLSTAARLVRGARRLRKKSEASFRGVPQCRARNRRTQDPDALDSGLAAAQRAGMTAEGFSTRKGRLCAGHFCGA